MPKTIRKTTRLTMMQIFWRLSCDLSLVFRFSRRALCLGDVHGVGSMNRDMFRATARWFVRLACLLLGLHAFPALACSAPYTQSQALAQCQAAVAQSAGNGHTYTCPAADLGPSGSSDLWAYELAKDGSALNGWYGSWEYCSPPCVSGFMPAMGSSILYSSADGVASYQGCCLSMFFGGPNSGLYVETGSACAGAGTSTPYKPPSETSNADGSKTYCDQNSGKCVTYNPNGGNPASSSSSANNSTDSTSQTNTSGSTSTTNSTSNTSGTTSGSDSGTGTGGTGSGSYSGTTTTTGTTDNPASSSSTSTKCDTGVCDVGNADGNIGNLYTPSTDTPSSVYAAFKQSVSSSAVVSSVTGFFSLSASGSCPVYTMAASKYVPAQTFDYFCQPGVLSYLQLAGFIVLAVGAFCAFRIALY